MSISCHPLIDEKIDILIKRNGVINEFFETQNILYECSCKIFISYTNFCGKAFDCQLLSFSLQLVDYNI